MPVCEAYRREVDAFTFERIQIQALESHGPLRVESGVVHPHEPGPDEPAMICEVFGYQVAIVDAIHPIEDSLRTDLRGLPHLHTRLGELDPLPAPRRLGGRSVPPHRSRFFESPQYHDVGVVVDRRGWQVEYRIPRDIGVELQVLVLRGRLTGLGRGAGGEDVVPADSLAPWVALAPAPKAPRIADEVVGAGLPRDGFQLSIDVVGKVREPWESVGIHTRRRRNSEIPLALVLCLSYGAKSGMESEEERALSALTIPHDAPPSGHIGHPSPNPPRVVPEGDPRTVIASVLEPDALLYNGEQSSLGGITGAAHVHRIWDVSRRI